MKTVICYYSCHHGNTRKVVEAMAEEGGAALVDLSTQPEAALEELPVSLPQPAKAVSIKARASTRLTRRFCIVTFLLRFTKNSLARIHTTFFK